ncbi:MAG: hypothetical protein JJT93_12075 [Gammaproteobacteria bacterium]|nr:hypothetical protein [Gammaproteobacteria bacterium]
MTVTADPVTKGTTELTSHLSSRVWMLEFWHPELRAFRRQRDQSGWVCR